MMTGSSRCVSYILVLISKQKILGECLLLSSLPGKVSKTHVESLGSRAIQHAFSKPNQVFYLSVYQVDYPVNSLFKLAIMTK